MDFEVKNLSVKNREGYIYVTYKGAIPIELKGAPKVPIVEKTVPIDDDESLDTVLILDTQWIPIEKGIVIPVREIGREDSFELTIQNPQYYSDIFPHRPLLGYHEGTLYGKRVVGLVIAVVKFDPADSTIYFLQRVTLFIKTRPSLSKPFRPKRSSKIAEMARTEAVSKLFGGSNVNSTEYMKVDRGGFNPTVPPSLDGSPVAYLIITNQELEESFETFRDWKTLCGYPAVIRTVEWIEDNYPGSDRAEKVRNFIKDAYELWGVQWILLGGDHEIIPMRYVYVNLPGAGEYRVLPTDRYYSCLEGNWNLDGDNTFGEMEDSIDLYPDVFVGRFPVRYPEEVQTIVSKVMNYEENTGMGNRSYVERALFMGSSMFAEGDGADLCEQVASRFPNNYFKGKIYETENYNPTTEEFIDSLNQGYGIVFTESHASFSFLKVCFTPSRSFRVGHIYMLENSSTPFFIHMVNCNSGGTDRECLADNFIRAGGGAFAVFSTTRLNYPYVDLSMTESLYDSLFMGDAGGLAQWINQGQLPFIPYAELYENYSRYIILGYNLLGDPSLILKTTTPKSLQVASPANIPLGSQRFAVTVYDSTTGLPISGVRVTVSKEAEIYTSALTGLAGEAIFYIEPETPGTLHVCVSGKDVITKCVDVGVIRSGNEVSISNVSLTDSNGGDGDGIPEQGETLSVYLTLFNSGTDPTPPFSIELKALREGFNVSPEKQVMGRLLPGEPIDVEAPFVVVTPNNITDRERVVFVLTFRRSLTGGNTILDIPSKGSLEQDTFTVTFRSPSLLKIGQKYYEMGDTGYIDIFLLNNGGGDAKDVEGVLTAQGVTMYDSVVSFGDLSPGQYLDEEDSPPFSFETPSSPLDSILWTFVLKDACGVSDTMNFYIGDVQPPDSLWADPMPLGFRLSWLPPESNFYSYRVFSALDSLGPYEPLNNIPITNSFYVGSDLSWGEERFLRVVSLDIFGNESSPSPWIKVFPNPPSLPGWPKFLVDLGPGAATVLDFLPESPGLEAVVPNKVGEIYAFSSNGELLDGWPLSLGEKNEFWSGAAAGDLDSDGRLEIVLVPWSDTNSVFALNSDGSMVQGWPVRFEGGNGQGMRGAFGPPVIDDIDGDGYPEVVVNTLRGILYIWRSDGSGFLDSTGFFYDLPDAAWAYSSPAVGDIDGDGVKEIVVGSNVSKVYALDIGGNLIDGFPVNVSGGIYTSPVLADFDPNTPGLEIGVGTYGNSVYIISNDGSILSGWPQIVPFSCDVCVGISAGNMDDDPEPELLVHGDDGLYAFNYDGTLLPGFPVPSGGGRSSAVVGDVDSDGDGEVFWNTNDGYLLAVNNQGETIYGFPVIIGDDGPSSPILVDIDQDGKTDILGTAGAGTFYGYNLLYQYGDLDWPMYKHDLGRTGCYSTDLRSGVLASKSLGPLNWTLIKPRPSVGGDVIVFSIYAPTDSKGKVEIIDVSGRVVSTIFSGTIKRGLHSFHWSGRDGLERRLPTGVYFLKVSFGGFQRTEKFLWISGLKKGR